MSANNGSIRNWGQSTFDLSFDEVQDSVRRDDTGKWDHTICRTDLTLRDGHLTFAFDKHGEHRESLAPTPWALRQLCERLGMPAGYFARCPAVLQDVQANHWLRHPAPSSLLRRRVQGLNGQGLNHAPANAVSSNGMAAFNGTTPRRSENWLLRARHGDLRGVLSDRYARLDNEALIACLRQLVQSGSHARFQVGWFGLSDESLHLRLVDTTIGRDVLKDDRLMAGIHIANSEVGKRAVTVDALIFRLICKNGLIRLVNGRSLLRRRHVSLDPQDFALTLEDAVAEAMDTALAFMEQLVLAAREPIGDPEAAIERLGRHWSLTDATQQQVRAALGHESPDQQETLYGLVNAITYVAQSLPDDNRYHLEVLAGQLAERGIHAAPRLMGAEAIAAVPLRENSEVEYDAQDTRTFARLTSVTTAGQP